MSQLAGRALQHPEFRRASASLILLLRQHLIVPLVAAEDVRGGL